jgi:hypothetical protein
MGHARGLTSGLCREEWREMAKSIVGEPGAAVAGVGAPARRENDGLAPPLLMSRPLPARIVLVLGAPALFGAICGWLLGVNKTAYLVLSALAIAGGYLAGQEHDRTLEGALRGLVGGGVFGGMILAAHSVAGTAEKTKLPHPHVVLVAVTVGFGVGLGALGARRRARRQADDRKLKFELSRLDRAELVGFVGSAIMFGALFMNWFSTACNAHAQPRGCNWNSEINNQHGSFNAFQTFKLLDILLVAACTAPFILAYLVATGRELTWRPGEVTMIVGITAFVLILCNGIILGRPGEGVDIGLGIGYVLALVASLGMLVAGYLRQAFYTTARKPPGVI